ncbi:hypothetical protein ASE00_13410 [Sphingomonas sp. Root710]|uniref:cytochrome P450 n=1 Tax=Sphingomonas sp. Root710 TaxID=1736594 RepID=UPI0006F3FCA9|nr:cytochrome P450 [Sphingomonas sp. Root710]KRB82983.1 hypothetical protein ASE00_13410 [Sphingomonas sp. Root710]
MNGKTEGDIQSGAVPDHVPPHLVKHFDFRTGLADRPQEIIARLHEGPPIFYSPVRHTMGSGAGMWVITRASDIRAVMSAPEVFSSSIQGEFLAAIGETIRLTPLDADPPLHGRFRALLNPLFTPKRMVELETLIRARCAALINRFEHRRSCEFIAEFATQFPTGVFIDLMGLPGERLDLFVGWAREFIHGETAERRIAAVRQIVDYFRALYLMRDGYGDDSILAYLLGRSEGVSLTEDEFCSLAFLLFSAGLDTVVSSLGFIFRFLAENEHPQSRLRADRKHIPRHVEEMMRLFAPVTPQRIATRDTVLSGVAIRKGDCLALSLAAASRDPAEFPDAGSFHAERNPNPHFAFGYGPHRCIGAQLARRNIAIAVEEWLTRLPPFRLAPDQQIVATGGSVLSLDGLSLVWG